jgi:hypothetical protein
MTKRSLSDITTGKQKDAPVRILIYGRDGVGKSSFAADAPNVIFQDTESSTTELDVARLPVAGTFDDAMANIEMLENERHEFKTYAIDTVDWFEPHIWNLVLKERPCDGNSIEDYGWKKGYTYAVDVWRRLLSRFELLQRRTGMNVIMVGHCAVTKEKNPQGIDYDRFDLKVNEQARGVLAEWPGATLFATTEILVSKLKDEKRGKGVSDGTRVVYTEDRAAFRAKNRYGLPPIMDLSWDTFWRYARGDLAETAEQVSARIIEAYPGNDKVAKKVTEFASNIRKLRAFENHLQQKANSK